MHVDQVSLTMHMVSLDLSTIIYLSTHSSHKHAINRLYWQAILSCINACTAAEILYHVHTFAILYVILTCGLVYS